MTSSNYRLPDFNYKLSSYIKKPWRLRWHFRSVQSYLGNEFVEYHKFLSNSLFWSEEEIKQYQWQKLKDLIDHSYRTVPFYQKQFKLLNIKPDDIRTLNDFQRLPIIDRNNLRYDLESFVSSEFTKHRGSVSRTSGTSGNVLKFYRSWYVESMRRAVQWRHFNQIGYFFKQRRCSFHIPFNGKDIDLLYKYDPIENHVMINGRMISMENGKAVYNLIKETTPILLYGHPSSITTFASVMGRLGLEPLKIPVIYVCSELISQDQRNRISAYVGDNIYDHYGNRENTISASQMTDGNYHVNSEFVLMELLDCNETHKGVEFKRVVGTCLNNYAMPLLRYDSNDRAYEFGKAENSKINHPTIKFIGGRDKNFLVTKDGYLYPQFDDIIVYEGFSRIEEHQVIQHDLENISLRIVVSNDYNKDEDEPILVDMLRRSTKNIYNISVDYVDAIPRTDSFKKPRVISKLAQADLKSKL